MPKATGPSNPEAVIATVREHLVENGHIGEETIADDESLFSSGMVSSLALVEIIDLVEDTYGIAIPPRDATLENLDTLQSIASFVATRAPR